VEQGDAEAQNNLGLMYANGRGVTEDDEEAVRFYRLAAEQGNAAAQSNLGLMYANGEGVPQEYVRAYMWFDLAAAQGWALAQTERDRLENKMTSLQIAEAQALAPRCLESNYSDCD